MSALPAFLGVILVALAAGLGVFLVITVAGKAFRGIGWLFGHVFGFIGGMVVDALRCVGALVVSPVFMLLAVGSVVIGRWSAATHYGRAVQTELKSASLCLYRLFVGRPMRFVGLGAVLEGYEHRLPEVMAQAPSRDTPRPSAGAGRKKNAFEGYTIVGSLPGGGSGGKLYIAEPNELKRAAFERRGVDVDRVVIKTFSLHEGSSLPQILRESRALDAAKKLGLVLEHELEDADRFFYVMRYVPGRSLSEVTRELHAESGAEGLSPRALRAGLGYTADLVSMLDHYHAGGLWHKDVKPDNIIVHDGRAELVDFGLITPLRSAMTLTTHGTEYFRDPELVRMALRGVKVHEVNGAKFDVFAAGAVLYATIENSFPAHGGLSRVTKRCPDAVKWIIRRAMTDYDKRYASAADMLRDLSTVMNAQDPFTVKPADLPSMAEHDADAIDADNDRAGAEDPFDVVAAGSPMPRRNEPDARPFDAGPPEAGSSEPGSFEPGSVKTPPAREPKPSKRSPRLRVVNWWTGRYAVDEAPSAEPSESGEQPSTPPVRPVAGRADRPRPTASAREQVRAARKRAAERRARARKAAGIRTRSGPGGGVGVGIAAVVVVTILFLGPGMLAWISAAPGNASDAAPAAMSPDTPNPPRLSASASVSAGSITASASGSASASVSGAPAASAPPVLAVADAEPLASVLFVNDIGPILTDDVRQRVAKLIARGYERGFRVRGIVDPTLFPQRVGTSIDFDGDIELISSAVLARADRSLELLETRDELRRWLADTPEVDAVYWMRSAPDARARGTLKGVRVLRLSERLEADTTLATLDAGSWDKLTQKLGLPTWPRATEPDATIEPAFPVAPAAPLQRGF
ncbi:MAG: hypothetical protein AAF108_07360 [Planctomycetota bacterium]